MFPEDERKPDPLCSVDCRMCFRRAKSHYILKIRPVLLHFYGDMENSKESVGIVWDLLRHTDKLRILHIAARRDQG